MQVVRTSLFGCPVKVLLSISALFNLQIFLLAVSHCVCNDLMSTSWLKTKLTKNGSCYTFLLVFPHCTGSFIYLFCLQRVKIMSELLISVSKAERQEARMKVRQESLRLGNVGVIRYIIHIKCYL